MKKLLCVSAMLLASFAATAQDRIITKSGDVLEAYRVDVGGSFIYYTRTDTDESALQKIAKDDVLMIKKQDNTVINLYEESVQPSTTSTTPEASGKEESPAGVVHITSESLSAEAKAANDAIITKLNTPVEYTPENEKDRKKTANRACAVLGIKEGSVMTNEDIEILVETGRKINGRQGVTFKTEWLFLASNQALKFYIKNKTGKTVYLDLGNTFYVSMGQALCYYVPSSTTTAQSSSGGVGVNLGAVAGALGIGGAAGTLANGVNVGGGSTKGTTSTTYAQRVVAVPPMSTVGLTPQYLFGRTDVEKQLCTGFSLRLRNMTDELRLAMNFSPDSSGGAMSVGEHYSYQASTSPLQMSFIVAYSTTEDCSAEKSITTHFYLKDLFGLRVNANGKLTEGAFNHNDGITFYVDVKDKDDLSFPKE